jgi:hypothetical protein
MNSQHRRQKNGTGSSVRGCAQVVQSIGSSTREACLTMSMIMGEDSSSTFEARPFSLLGFCKENPPALSRLWPLKGV